MGPWDTLRPTLSDKWVLPPTPWEYSGGEAVFWLPMTTRDAVLRVRLLPGQRSHLAGAYVISHTIFIITMSLIQSARIC